MKSSQSNENNLLLRKLTDEFIGNEEEQLQWSSDCKNALEQSPFQIRNAVEKRIKARDSSPFLVKKLLSAAPLFAILAATTIVVIASILLYKKYHPLFSVIRSFDEYSTSSDKKSFPLARTKKLLSEEEILFVFGDTDERVEGSKRTLLYKRNPNNLTYLSDFLIEKSNPPREEFERAIELDPENGWFKLFYASHLSKMAIVRNQEHYWDKTQPKWKCEDPDLLERALELTYEAGRDPKFFRYPTVNHEKRMALLPPAKNMIEQVQYTTVLASESSPDGVMILRLKEGIVWKARELSKQGDSEGFLNLVETAFRFVPKSMEQNKSFVGSLVHMVYLRKLAKDLTPIAKEMGLDKTSDELEQLEQEVKKIRTWITSGNEPAKSPLQYGSILVALSTSTSSGLGLPEIKQPTPKDWEPNRMLEHLQIETFYIAFSAAVLFLSSLISFLLALLGRKHTKKIARHMEVILRPRDFLRIVLLSFIVPIFTYVVITRFTPLGCLDWSWKHSGGLPFALNLGLTLYLFLFLPIAITTSIIRKRLGELQLAKKSSWWIWLPTLLTSFALIAALTFRFYGPPAAIVAAVAAGFGFWFCLGHALLMTWGKKRSFLARIIGLRSLSISLACLAILVTTLLIPLALRESHWVKREDYLPTKLSSFHLNSLEFHLDQEIRIRLNDCLSSSPLSK